jgi:hypothetical protein
VEEMNERSKVLETFISKLLTVVPSTISVYEFTKELAQYDKRLENKKGLVLVIDDDDYSLETLLLIDLIYDTIQDEFGWREGTAFASSFSRGYIRTRNNLWHINIQNSHCLLPEDMINLKNTRQLLHGEDIILRIGFPHQEKEILKISPGLTRKDTAEIAEKYPQYKPLVEPECCLARHDFVIEHSIISILEDNFVMFKNYIKPEKNAHMYGRYWGSGKTQIMYSLIKKCKELQISFIYRTEFWKDENGKYLDLEHNSENDPDKVSEWVALHAPSPQFVLFLDEVDIDIKLLNENLKAKYEGYDPMYYIISGAKEISDFVDESFDVYDIVKEYPFNETQFRELIEKLIDISNLDKTVFADEIIDIIVKKTRLWNHSSIRKTPTAIILTATLALAESIKKCDELGQQHVILPEIAEKWALLGTSPLYQLHGELHDVHAEYLIFDGQRYTEKDKHYHHPIP